jgi:hypothetical protein
MSNLEKVLRVLRARPSARRLATGAARRLRNVPYQLSWSLSADGRANRARLARLRDKHRGERCFIVGNGPSLRRTNLDSLVGEPTFGLNRVHLCFEWSSFRPTYLCCFNPVVTVQFGAELASVGELRFVNHRAGPNLPPSDTTLHLLERFSPTFREEPTKGLWGGGTVTFVALQLAYFMGFSRVVLLGVDHRFSARGEPNRRVVSGPRDHDHFDQRYYAGGVRWDLPDLATSEWSYSMARGAFERAGRTVVDATVDGALTVFPKVRLEDELGR